MLQKPTLETCSGNVRYLISVTAEYLTDPWLLPLMTA